MNNNELRHHGIKGMKWGVRRYQNKDGSLTSAGKRRLAKNTKKNWTPSNSVDGKYVGVKVKINNDGSAVVTEKYKTKSERQIRRETNNSIKKDRASASKNRRTLSDADIDARINRLKKEKQLKELIDADVHPGRTAVKNFMKTSGTKVLTAAATGAMAYAGYSFMEDKGWVKAAAYMFPNPHKKK